MVLYWRELAALIDNPSLLIVTQGDHRPCSSSSVAILETPEYRPLGQYRIIFLGVTFQTEGIVSPETNGTRALEVSEHYPSTLFMGLTVWSRQVGNDMDYNRELLSE
jgi:hypothetical protein